MNLSERLLNFWFYIHIILQNGKEEIIFFFFFFWLENSFFLLGNSFFLEYWVNSFFSLGNSFFFNREFFFLLGIFFLFIRKFFFFNISIGRKLFLLDWKCIMITVQKSEGACGNVVCIICPPPTVCSNGFYSDLTHTYGTSKLTKF